MLSATAYIITKLMVVIIKVLVDNVAVQFGVGGVGCSVFGFLKTGSYQFPGSQSSFSTGALMFWHGSFSVMFALQLLYLQLWAL